MSGDTTNNIVETVRAMRPILPAKDFEVSKQFYSDLGFHPEPLTDNLVEMHLGAYSFILQRYYVQQWADNFVMHMRVSDLSLWWNHVRALDLESRYGTRTRAPQLDDLGLVAGLVDPSGVLWRITQVRAPDSD